MNILNIMLGRGKGGLEQAAVDYHEALLLAGHHVTTITRTGAWAASELSSLNGENKELNLRGEWDIFAAKRLRQMGSNADCVIAHGNRAIGLALKAFKGTIPVIGVAHNYNIKRFPKCDGVFSITRDLIEEMVHLDMPRHKLFHIPNMIRVLPVAKRTAFRNPPTISTMGRFVEKKGFDIFVHALQIVKSQGVEFKAVIGGDGELAPILKKQASDFELDGCLEFSGWVEDKQQLFADADIFVLPSHHEPFGIVLIEAMAAGLPCITTDTEGPCEIIKQHHDAVMIDKAKPHAMAQAIMELIESPERAVDMGYHAHLKARDRYDIHVVSEQLNEAITHVTALASDTT